MNKKTVIYIALVLLAPLTWLHLVTLQTLWGWFVVDIFNMPVLTKLQWLGLGMFYGYFTNNIEDHSDKDTEALLKELIKLCIRPIVALALGWIVHHFV